MLNLNEDERFGDYLRVARIAAGISETTFADLAEIPINDLYGIELCEVSPPATADTLIRFADLCGIQSGTVAYDTFIGLAMRDIRLFQN